MPRKPSVALASLLVCSLSFAQQFSTPSRSLVPAVSAAENAAAIAQKNSFAAIPAATSACNWTFTSPQTAANKYLEFCVTVNGNIVEFQSPSGVEHIRVGGFGEGYGICDGTAGGAVPYYDYADAGDSGNWQAPTTLAVTTTSVKIARTTSDGIWTLTQNIVLNKPTASAYVTMALKNNTAATRLATIIRYADVDAGGVFGNNLDGTLDSAWGYDPIGSSPPYAGLKLQVNGPNTFNHQGWAINVAVGPNPCTPNANFVGTLTNTDGAIISWNLFPSVAKSATKTVKLKYTAF